MLAIAVSLLFGLAAFSALAVLASSLTSGARRARAILAELAEIERRVTRAQAAGRSLQAALHPAFAIA